MAENTAGRDALVSLRLVARVLGAYVVLLVVAAIGLGRWLTLDFREIPRGPYVVTAWRDGARVARAVVTERPESALATERATSGTTVVIERVGGEARAVVVGPVSFALSFRPGRDGVHVSFRGRDAYLTSDELVHDRLVRKGPRVGWLELGRRVDPGSVLARLGRELRADPKELWREATFRRFVSTRSVVAEGASAPLRREPLTANALATTAKSIGLFLSSRVDSEGYFTTEGLLRSRGPYDWELHARAIAALAEAARLVDEIKLRVAARRAVRRLHDMTRRCGEHECVGTGDVVETSVSVAAIDAYATMAGPMRAQALIEATRPLADFVRSQQRPSGDFAWGYDRKAKKMVEHREHTTELTANAVSALAFAYTIGRNPADLAAAQRGVAALARTQRWLPRSRPVLVWSAICSALGKVRRRGAPDPDALARCSRWALGIQGSQARPDQLDVAGGFAGGLFETPTTISTAEVALGISGALEYELGPGNHDEKVIRALAVELSHAIEFLEDQYLPGNRAYRFSPSTASFGAVAEGPFTADASLESTVSAGSAMLRYLSIMESRDPARRKFEAGRKKAPPPVLR
jgi:hypothetical protein